MTDQEWEEVHDPEAQSRLSRLRHAQISDQRGAEHRVAQLAEMRAYEERRMAMEAECRASRLRQSER